MATPVLADLRRHWPSAKLTAMCQARGGQLIENDPHIDELFEFRKPSGWIHRVHNSDILMPLRHGDYDLGILLTNSLSSAWWFWRGHVKNRIGYAKNGRSFLLNKAVPFPEKLESQHLVITYKNLLEPLGIPLSDTPPKLYVTAEEREAVKELLLRYGITEQHTLIGINPGAAYGSAKCWLPERFHEVALKLLTDPQVRIIFFGDPSGASLVQTICQGLDERVVNLAGKTTLRELLALIEQCKVFLTNDSGPMHIAAALNTPLVALFGSTSDIKTGPYGQAESVIHKRVACSPCYQRTCPIDFRCMKQIGVDEVVQAIQQKLNNPHTVNDKLKLTR